MLGPRASSGLVADSLLPVLANCDQILKAEKTSHETYKATVAASFPPHPLPPVSTLNYEEGIGSWVGYATPLSVETRLLLLRVEEMMVQRFSAIMSGYGVDPYGTRYSLGDEGIRPV